LIPTSIKEPEGVAKETPPVHAIVVTWNGAHLLPDCLAALERQEPRPHVVVVDNGSIDSTAEVVAKFPRVELLELDANLGYGRANNQAMRRALDAGVEFVALVNNDVEVEPGWLEKLLDAARARPEIGLLTGTLLFRGEERVNSTGLEIDRFGRARDRDFGVDRSRLERADGSVAGVSGGAALLRASMLRTVGLFDPAYFAYYEDVDLSLRAAEAGFGCWYVRDAIARHRFGATLGPGSPRRRYLLGRGHLRTLARHQPLLKAAALVPLTVAYRTVVKAPLELLRARPSLALAEWKAAGAGAADALKAFIDRSRSRR
jgi:GT2 family glycosyltransferase